jgi:7-keto-8-aminopelargonate synthetase-like enzyme
LSLDAQDQRLTVDLTQVTHVDSHFIGLMMLAKGVYVIGFSYPVVPHGKARIRTQMSAALTREDVLFAMDRFAEAGRELKLIP